MVVEGDGNVRMPGGLGKVGELGDVEVALLEAELGAVGGLQVDGDEVQLSAFAVSDSMPATASCPS